MTVWGSTARKPAGSAAVRWRCHPPATGATVDGVTGVMCAVVRSGVEVRPMVPWWAVPSAGGSASAPGPAGRCAGATADRAPQAARAAWQAPDHGSADRDLEESADTPRDTLSGPRG